MSDTNETHEHSGCCCPTDPVEVDRNFADAIRGRSQTFLNKEGLPVARAMLAATRAILTARGGLIGEKAVWLRVAEAHLPQIEEKHDQAASAFVEVLAFCEKELGAEHYATGVCLLNAADAYMTLDRPADAVPLFDRAEPVLKKALDAATEDYMREFLDGALQEVIKGSRLAHDKLGK